MVDLISNHAYARVACPSNISKTIISLYLKFAVVHIEGRSVGLKGNTTSRVHELMPPTPHPSGHGPLPSFTVLVMTYKLAPLPSTPAPRRCQNSHSFGKHVQFVTDTTTYV